MFFYAVMDASSKRLLVSMPAAQIFFFRSAITLLLISSVLPFFGGRAALKTDRVWLHCLRSLLGIAALYLILISFRTLQLTQVLSVLYLTPLLVAVLSTLFPGEEPVIGDWVRAICGLIAVAIVLQPNLHTDGAAVAVPIVGAVLLAGYLVSARLTPAAESSLLFPFIFTVVCTAVSGIALPLVWRPLDPTLIPLLIIMGCAGAIGLFCRNYAYVSRRPAFVAPFEYTNLVWAIVFGYLFFGDVPHVSTIIASIGIIAVNLIRARSP
jgi:drug/metabolite transporter (DMT)-like permease